MSQDYDEEVDMDMEMQADEFGITPIDIPTEKPKRAKRVGTSNRSVPGKPRATKPKAKKEVKAVEPTTSNGNDANMLLTRTLIEQLNEAKQKAVKTRKPRAKKVVEPKKAEEPMKASVAKPELEVIVEKPKIEEPIRRRIIRTD